MVLIKILRPETAQALSDRAVIAMAVGIGLASLLLVLFTVRALLGAGHVWLAALVALPLGAGLGRHAVDTVRYCRPAWFK
ncbi:hypothetical protein ACV344_30915 [Pseudomonas aeruginosa]|uniref:hypothetical protein n=1 Tax=Pseudomonas aeruginosa TaxID=287 RepID=UPI000E679C3C|nr:hypothetical protein [Pseudomonas aeruginosa]MBA5106268.1 hypothetical protein [Pseudomonas aeruginosa]MBD1300834.1 hypothetical protein [Pseudomonas aeruginosa]MBD1341601.1 hypothetical protein [Pseudomonas aeruginosa]MBG4604317.1 hypothetical protein [Pseudomonas aeruginosa]MBH3593035.1 hypothetical protein [Pseudomonas aeruginosa]